MLKPLLTVSVASLAVLASQSYAQDMNKCTPKGCDAECKAYFEANQEQITHSWMQLLSLPFSRQCGDIASPQARDECYVENVTHAFGYTPATFDAFILDRYTRSTENPSVGRCVKAQQEAATKQRLDEIKAIQEAGARRQEEVRKVYEERDRKIEEQRLQMEAESVRSTPPSEAQNLMGQSLNSLLQGALNQ
jgi:hypothetical protein